MFMFEGYLTAASIYHKVANDHQYGSPTNAVCVLEQRYFGISKNSTKQHSSRSAA